jgi:hypothetical protein
MPPVFWCIVMAWVVIRSWEAVRAEYAHTRDTYATGIARDHPDWSPRRVHRAARWRARSYWMDEIAGLFPSFRASFAEHRLTARAARAEDRAASRERIAGLWARLDTAQARAAQAGHGTGAGTEPGPAPERHPSVDAAFRRAQEKYGPENVMDPPDGRTIFAPGPAWTADETDDIEDDPEPGPQSPRLRVVRTEPGAGGTTPEPAAAPEPEPWHAMGWEMSPGTGTGPAWAIGEAEYAEPEDGHPGPAGNRTENPGEGEDMTAIDDLEGADSPYQGMLSHLVKREGAAQATVTDADDLAAVAAQVGFDRDTAFVADMAQIADATAALAAAYARARNGLVTRHEQGDEYHAGGGDAHDAAFRPA